MIGPKEVADYTPGFNKIISDFIHRLRSVREPSGSEKETKSVNSIMNFSNGCLSLWRRCCLTEGLVVSKRKSTKRHRFL